MPTYEYECLYCKYQFEISQKITDQPLDKCPSCHKKVKRLIGSGSGLIFKGSGFYATDYRKKQTTEPSKTKPDACPKMKEGCSGCSQK